ncbi:hypothetical protein D3C86_1769190 [compost metagenome]
MPSTREGVLTKSELTDHVPTIFARVFAKGPITATVPFFCKGRSWLSFFNSTKDFVAASRATFRFAGVNNSV